MHNCAKSFFMWHMYVLSSSKVRNSKLAMDSWTSYENKLTCFTAISSKARKAVTSVSGDGIHAHTITTTRHRSTIVDIYNM